MKRKRILLLLCNLDVNSGTIPISLSNASDLEHISLGDNKFVGKVPTNLGRLERLQAFMFDINFLGSGEADDMNFLISLTNCSALEDLTAMTNQLGGTLPNSVGNLSTQLQSFGVAENQLYGEVPLGFGNLAKLEILQLGFNQFEGQIPHDIGILDHDNLEVAVKVLHLERRGASKSFMVECETLRNIRHRNLVKIITSCSSIDFQGNDFKALVYELMPNGSLEKWLHYNGQDEPPKLNMQQKIHIAIDVANALNYLHHHCEEPIIHCDLKPSNVLLDGDMVARVGDFGLAKFSLPELSVANQSSSIGIRGTIGYAAPEYGLGSEVSMNGDIYSYGILLLEMITEWSPVDPLFDNGLSLHNYALKALPNRVMEIVKPTLQSNCGEVLPTASSNGNQLKDSLISMIKIGVACSMESPQDRMDLSDVIRELYSIRRILEELEVEC
ncbi:hypothetical protein LguiA_030711 [Lonicera macranthoides]